jgi:hypothetical protein
MPSPCGKNYIFCLLLDKIEVITWKNERRHLPAKYFLNENKREMML